ncbi:hypothetical protein SAMN04487911_10997 [Arenibacter nanhaiticus]|uniref:Uncharacterized protein n=1 Tax=Arenibacter nanhaiticus TaxID=558155 RepID=A0A1M6FVB6_9FLAO|nr:hypothetical protein SAMN04487911_10997 [Arenibacter nanhaiticus]
MCNSYFLNLIKHLIKLNIFSANGISSSNLYLLSINYIVSKYQGDLCVFEKK